jgi:lipopolysaccharide/colanic/teichoic acid biosynthesis glycosyltransferase
VLVNIAHVGELPSLFEPTSTSSMDYRGKRLLDLTLTMAAAPLWVPLLAVVGIIVRVWIGSPVLFRQQRPGKDERLFRLLKFRTMTDARGPDGALLPDGERLTHVGRFLRSTSLDELPELINVLRGDMSLVGPRPLLPQYLELYSREQRERHSVSPGLTGLAQVEGRNALSWQERLDLDVRYARESSLSSDLRIMWRTLFALVARRGISAPGHATMPAFTGTSAAPSEEARPGGDATAPRD